MGIRIPEKKKKGTIKTVFTQARGKAERKGEMISVYTPPNHRMGTMHLTKADAERED